MIDEMRIVRGWSAGVISGVCGVVICLSFLFLAFWAGVMLLLYGIVNLKR